MDKKTLRTLMVLMVGVGLNVPTSYSMHAPPSYINRPYPVRVIVGGDATPDRTNQIESVPENDIGIDPTTCPCPYNDYSCRWRYCE